MTFELLDGSKLAETVRAEIRAQVTAFVARHGRAPGPHVVLVGDDPASQVYTRNKEKASNEVGMRGRLHTLPATTTQAELLAAARFAQRRRDGRRHPRPAPAPQADRQPGDLDAVVPTRTSTAFTPSTSGSSPPGVPVSSRAPRSAACACSRRAVSRSEGPMRVVVGRSNIVGKPVAQLLLAEDATVTIAHSKTRRPAGVVPRRPTCSSLPSEDQR
jgi:methylenetetrahydrofolate dehydrogenase (NADP+)/methenyltetrahydrofolate cyclohydrolase